MKLMEKLTILLLLVGMMACGRPISPEALVPTTANGEYRLLVTGVAQFDDAFDKRWRPYYQVGDEEIGPIFVLLSNSRVCIVPMLLWSLRPTGQPVTCAWRIPHSINRPEPLFRSE